MTFNEKWRQRTRSQALAIVSFHTKMKKTDETRIMGKQLLRSATSVAANFLASCTARSKRERYAKLCIVVEEAAETVFWLDMLQASGFATEAEIFPLMQESTEILKVMSSTRKSLKPLTP